VRDKPGVYGAFGCHPLSAAEWDGTMAATVRRLVSTHPSVVAVGECGLDYHYERLEEEQRLRQQQEEEEQERGREGKMGEEGRAEKGGEGGGGGGGGGATGAPSAGATTTTAAAATTAKSAAAVTVHDGYNFGIANAARSLQHEVFVAQMRMATELGAALIVHTREAEEDTLRWGGCTSCECS
jgi:hypothetical protein